MAAEGHAVSVVARSHADCPGVDWHEYDLDSLRPACVLESIRQRRGPVDAIAFFQRFRGSTDAWEGELRTSLSATKSFIEESERYFGAQSLRSIALVSSVNATFISPSLPPGYHVAKAGLCQLARYYACTLGVRGIRVNAVCPSTFVKPETERYYADHPEEATRLTASSPLGKIPSYRDVNDAVRFLLGEHAAFITGQTLFVDGGISLRWPQHL